MDEESKKKPDQEPTSDDRNVSRRQFLGTWSKIVIGAIVLGSTAPVTAHADTSRESPNSRAKEELSTPQTGDDADTEPHDWSRWRRWNRYGGDDPFNPWRHYYWRRYGGDHPVDGGWRRWHRHSW